MREERTTKRQYVENVAWSSAMGISMLCFFFQNKPLIRGYAKLGIMRISLKNNKTMKIHLP